MAKSLIPIQAGMRYQAWLFWSYAAGLLRNETGFWWRRHDEYDSE